MNQILQDQDQDPAFQPGDDGDIAAVNDGATAANDDVEFHVVPMRDKDFAARVHPRLWPRMELDHDLLIGFLDACRTSAPRVTYGLGAKVPFHGAVPGQHFTRIDCSGFVRAAIRLATDPMVKFPDGSVVQHDWVRDWNYAPGTVDDGGADDDRMRIAFLPPSASVRGIGHVALLLNGWTLESHGGVGPNRRQWNTLSWRHRCNVYRLD